ncbi:CBS domain-containing protein [Roseomonas sp. E05]|uniref:CBS domain-containing protein n=1 Tax=Roseomonas sp. E05 TaxID=3046310 RepID=UPI0024BA7FA0|nr:CBS domain-containing protein [Roseomonas sp. E05]MDJ0388805.1 CBS domain-containing protein [Roseomonas sp. E05]
MLARDSMTQDVVTVPEDMAVAGVARVLAEAGISAVLVTDGEHRLLGIVAELDLIRGLSEEDAAPQGWLASLFADRRGLAERYARVHGLRAGDVMTRHVATVSEAAPAEAIAWLMEEKGIRSVPVVTGDGRLCGIVSRSDLLRAVLAAAPAVESPQGTLDARIQRDILEAMRQQPWADLRRISVEVRNGVVRLEGYHRSPEAQHAARILAERIEGVEAVEDQTRLTPARYQYGFGGPL